jgi:hypothetical protein
LVCTSILITMPSCAEGEGRIQNSHATCPGSHNTRIYIPIVLFYRDPTKNAIELMVSRQNFLDTL